MAEDKKSIKDLLSSCLEKYEKARKLIDEESKKDPESEPYKSLYVAKDLLSEVKDELVRVSDDDELEDGPLKKKVNILTAAMNYNIGVISIETEELSTGEEHLMKCEEGFTGGNNEMDPQWILLVLYTLNQLGILWSMRCELKKSAEYLEKSESLSKKYRNEVGLPPYDVVDLFVLDDDEDGRRLESNWPRFEKTLTHTLYYLAQVYTSQNETVKAAVYCHTTLRRQLQSKDFDPIEWAVNAATLSQFFVAQNSYGDARHHLACATYVLNAYEAEVNSRKEGARTENHEELLESIRHRRADVSMCWGKYGLLLLSVSWDDLMRHSVGELVDDMNKTRISDSTTMGREEEGEGEGAMATALTSKTEEDEQAELLFCSSLGKNSEKPHMVFKSLEVTAIEEQVTTKRVLDFEQARNLFLITQKWFNLAKEYYSLGSYTSDYVQIVQDVSKLYRVLAYFESSEDRCCKMHKRRIDMLESTLIELNPRYYLGICRQLQFELAETYSEMMSLKLTRLESETSQTSRGHIANKVNHLAEQSLKYFKMFLDTMLDAEGKMPEEFAENMFRPAMLAYFFTGRLHSKIITPDPNKQMENLRASIQNYQVVCDYCEKFPTAAEAIKEELWICKEMVELLPKKMQKILSSV